MTQLKPEDMVFSSGDLNIIAQPTEVRVVFQDMPGYALIAPNGATIREINAALGRMLRWTVEEIQKET